MKDFILEAQDLTREVRLLADCCIRPSFHLELYDCNGTALDRFTFIAFTNYYYPIVFVI